MFDSELELERYCKRQDIDVSKIPEWEWDNAVECLEIEFEAYIEHTKEKLMISFFKNVNPNNWSKYKLPQEK